VFAVQWTRRTTLPAELTSQDSTTPGAIASGAPVGKLFRFIGLIGTIGGWRGALLTIVLGAIAASALPPVYFLPGLIAFSALAWRLEGRVGPVRAAWRGWLFGFGYHLVGLYWISNALLVESDRFAVFVPLAAIGLPMVLAFFPAAAMAIVPRIAAPGWTRALVVAGMWSLAEFARGHLFTGFPWNLPTYALSFSEEMSQAAAVLGAYGLGLVVLVAAMGPALALGPDRGWARSRGWIGVLCLTLPAWAWAGGAARLAAADPGMDETVIIRLVQGNIAQKDKWKPELRGRHIAHYLELSQQSEPTHRAPGLSGGESPTVIIWPETAVPGFLAQSRELRRALATVAPAGGSLVTGAPSVTEATPRRIHNSLIGIGADGLVNARYDKVHLVPFGEYVPLRSWLSLPRVVQSFTDFTPGTSRAPIAIKGLGLVSPLICYEVIFPGEVADTTGPSRPRALLNLTNDAWYGRSSGPYQHLMIARMRAIEEGIPLIRASNTGISGIYDAYGRMTVQLDLGETGIVDGYLPMLIEDQTIYSRTGDVIYFIILIALSFGIYLRKSLFNS
jgi:apolipoprotein N-acyltransferase